MRSALVTTVGAMIGFDVFAGPAAAVPVTWSFHNIAFDDGGSRRLLQSVMVGQVAAALGLGLYAGLVKPLIPQDLVGAVLAGVVLDVLLECWRRGRER